MVDIIKRRTDIDFTNFKSNNMDLEVKYGLPSKIEFCEKCVVSNQRPNSCVEYDHTNESKKETIHFDDKGVCDACRTAEKKNQLTGN